MRTTLLALIVVTLAFWCRAAYAAPIMFIHAGMVAPQASPFSGTLDGVPFTTESIVITAFGNTNDRLRLFPNAEEYDIPHTSAEIAIDGLGTFEFLSGTRTYSANGHVGFSFHEVRGPDLFIGPLAGGWDMLSSIGPISENGHMVGQWDISPVQTTGGVLFFNPYIDVPRMFRAIIIPEPASWLSFGTLLGWGAISRWWRSMLGPRERCYRIWWPND